MIQDFARDNVDREVHICTWMQGPTSRPKPSACLLCPCRFKSRTNLHKHLREFHRLSRSNIQATLNLDRNIKEAMGAGETTDAAALSRGIGTSTSAPATRAESTFIEEEPYEYSEEAVDPPDPELEGEDDLVSGDDVFPDESDIVGEGDGAEFAGGSGDAQERYSRRWSTCKEEAYTVRHLLCHYPKNKHCKACNRSKVRTRAKRRKKLARTSAR